MEAKDMLLQHISLKKIIEIITDTSNSRMKKISPGKMLHDKGDTYACQLLAYNFHDV